MSGHDETVDEATGVLMNGAAAVSRVAETLIRRRQDQQLRQVQETERSTEEFRRRYEAQARGAEQFYRTASDPTRLAAGPVGDVATTWKGAHQWAQVDPERFGPHADRINRAVLEGTGVDGRRELAMSGKSLDEADAVLAAAFHRAQTERDQATGEQTVQQRERTNAAAAAGTDGEDLDGEESRERARVAGNAAEDHLEAAEAVEADGYADYDTEQRRAATEQFLRDANVPDEAIAAKMTADRLNGQHPRTAAAVGRQAQRGKRPVRRGRAASQTRTRDTGRER